MVQSKHDMSRRTAIAAMAGAPGALWALNSGAQQEGDQAVQVQLKGRVKHSVSRWCYGRIPLPELAVACKEIGIASIELVGPRDWPTLQEHGLTCAMPNGPGPIERGWNDPDNHDRLVRQSEELLPQIAEAGYSNMIVFSGNRENFSDEDGWRNCARGLERILPMAEELGVTVCMELLNSKRDHRDYQCDNTPWGVELAKQIGSARFKLLYDIYHMQIMEGDVIQTILDNLGFIEHFHTGGVPGRNEIDETQELNYRRIVEAIYEAGYTGYIGQEFVPKRDPLTSLREAVLICDV